MIPELQSVIKYLNRAINSSKKSPEIRERLSKAYREILSILTALTGKDIIPMGGDLQNSTNERRARAKKKDRRSKQP